MVGGPVANGTTNTNILSLYNKDATGILPVNHKKFESSANFTSDVTNLNQFYNNNPEIFHKEDSSSSVYVPNPSDWDAQSKALFSMKENESVVPVQPYNYEQGPNNPML